MASIQDLLEMVKYFTIEVVDLPIPDAPKLLSAPRMAFRGGHIQEELDEIHKAYADSNLAEVADGFLDVIYVALGALTEMGIPPGAAFEEVHRANMDKKRGSLAKRPNSVGYDAVKPEGWQPPDLAPYLTITKAQVMAKQTHRAERLSKMKLLVIGYGRHGKDTASEILEKEYGLSYQASSMFCAEAVIMPAIDKLRVNSYGSAQECFDDRHNYRDFWYRMIQDYNRPDPTKLAREMLKTFDIYCGMRSHEELIACVTAGLFDAIIWVDRSEYLPPESSASCSVSFEHADYIVDNNGSLEDLKRNLVTLMETKILCKP